MTEKEKEKFESLKKELTIVICAYKANSAFTYVFIRLQDMDLQVIIF